MQQGPAPGPPAHGGGYPQPPYGNPSPQGPPAAASLEEQLKQIPFYRRSSVASAALFLALILAAFGSIFAGPSLASSGQVVATLVGLVLGAPLLAVCIIVLTGNIYYNAFDAQGQLSKWGIGNKIVAVLILGGWVYSIVRSFL